MWAKTNLDNTQASGFAISEFQYNCSFVSWGNVEVHNPVSDSAFEYDWGSVNAQSPYYDGQPYGGTPGCNIQTNIGLSFDVAHVLSGRPWRMPSMGDFGELFDNVDFIDADGVVIDPSTADKRVTVNDILGIYVQSKINGARLFFPCSGMGSGTSLNNRAGTGAYWSSSIVNVRDAYACSFDRNGLRYNGTNQRYSGFCVRPVWRIIQ